MTMLVVWVTLAAIVLGVVWTARVVAWWERRLRCRRVWRQAQRILIVADERRRKDRL